MIKMIFLLTWKTTVVFCVDIMCAVYVLFNFI